eukprot:3257619-Rhodomonas_salina.2
MWEGDGRETVSVSSFSALSSSGIAAIGATARALLTLMPLPVLTAGFWCGKPDREEGFSPVREHK